MVPYDHIKERPHLHPITMPAMQKMSYLCVSYYGNDSKYDSYIHSKWHSDRARQNSDELRTEN